MESKQVVTFRFSSHGTWPAGRPASQPPAAAGASCLASLTSRGLARRWCWDYSRTNHSICTRSRARHEDLLACDAGTACWSSHSIWQILAVGSGRVHTRIYGTWPGRWPARLGPHGPCMAQRDPRRTRKCQRAVLRRLGTQVPCLMSPRRRRRISPQKPKKRLAAFCRQTAGGRARCRCRLSHLMIISSISAWAYA